MKTIIMLLLPVLMLAAIAAYSFIVPMQLAQIDQNGRNNPDRQKFEKFVSAVISGKAQGTPEQYIHAIQLQQTTLQGDDRLKALILDGEKAVGWGAVFGIALQLIAIYYTNRKFKNMAA